MLLIDSIIESNNMLIIKYLLEKFTERTLDASNTNYWLIIKYIIKYNSIESLKYLISLNININAINGTGQTILHHVCEDGNIDMVKFLVQNCPDLMVNRQDNTKGFTPILAACDRYHDNIVKYLINNCKNLNLDCLSFQNNTLIHMVCEDDFTVPDINIVQLLLEKNCSILKNSRNKYPFELLDLNNLIKLLLKLGDRIPEFIKPEYLGDHTQNLAVANLLLQQSIDVNNPELNNIIKTMSSNVSTYSSVKNSVFGLLSWVNITRSQTDLERFNDLKNIYKNKLLTGNLGDMKKLDYSVIKTLFSHDQLAEILVEKISSKNCNEEAMLVLIRKISDFYNIKNLIYNDNNIFWHALRYYRVKLAVFMLTIDKKLLKSVPNHMYEITDLALINIWKELLKKEQEDIMNQINRANSNQNQYNHQRYW